MVMDRFVESENNPKTDPIAFWTNGGPGCSGLLGFLTEQGPFKPAADLSLEENEYRWNRIANMVFIEAPAGVGFSYSDDKVDYTTGDAQVAQDNYNLIQVQYMLCFLGRFVVTLVYAGILGPLSRLSCQRFIHLVGVVWWPLHAYTCATDRQCQPGCLFQPSFEVQGVRCWKSIYG
jgi:hypothetical protein